MADKQVRTEDRKLVRCSSLTPVQWGGWQDYINLRKHSPEWARAAAEPGRYAVYLTADESRPAMNVKMLDVSLNMLARLLTYVTKPDDAKTAKLRDACVGAVCSDVIDCGPALTVYADRLEEIGDEYEAAGTRYLTAIMRHGLLYYPRLKVLYGMNDITNTEISYGR
jgi:hypothetical protein